MFKVKKVKATEYTGVKNRENLHMEDQKQDYEIKYPLAQAKVVAEAVLAQIEPHAYRCAIAGSIRREKEFVKDIEIVCIPKPYENGLFEDRLAAVVNQWRKVKGELQYGKCKYTQRLLPDGIKLDLFFAVPENWGLIFAIRTGSAEYSHNVLAKAWVSRGYTSVNGFLTANGKTFNCYEEKDLFARLNIPYTEPKNRNYNETTT